MECYLCNTEVTTENSRSRRGSQKRYCLKCFEEIKGIKSQKEIEELKKKMIDNRYVINFFKCDMCGKEEKGKMYSKVPTSNIKVCHSCKEKVNKDIEEYQRELLDKVKSELDYYTEQTGIKLDEVTRSRVYSSINNKFQTSIMTYGGMLFTIDYCKLKLGYAKFNEYLPAMIFNQYENARNYFMQRLEDRKKMKNVTLEPQVIKIKRKKGLNQYKHKIKLTMEELMNE